MCQKARLTISTAFFKIRNLESLKAVITINTTFAAKLTAAARQDNRCEGLMINSHWVEEATADVMARFAGKIKAGELNVAELEGALAREIKGRAFLLTGDLVGDKDVLR